MSTFKGPSPGAGAEGASRKRCENVINKMPGSLELSLEPQVTHVICQGPPQLGMGVPEMWVLEARWVRIQW